MKTWIRLAIECRAVSYFIVFVLLVGGVASFKSLGQLEDPVFTVKTASIITRYPGASPEEVEQEVTDRLEKAIQQMTQLDTMYSISKAGESIIKVNIQSTYWADRLPQVWDELRRKINDVTAQLPPGAEKPLVNDEFGFVYGFLLTLSGDGFTDREIEEAADVIKQELSLVKGVTRVELWGVQQQTIEVELSERELSRLGLTGATIVDTLKEQNLVVDSGGVDSGSQRLRVSQTGEFRSPLDIAQLTIHPRFVDTLSHYQSIIEQKPGVADASTRALREVLGTENIIRIGDIAKVTRSYQSPPGTIFRFNGFPSIAIAAAGANDENIVQVGMRLEERLEGIRAKLPIGLELEKLAWQSEVVNESVNSFLVSLMQAIAIVLVVLVIPSGFRMGFIIGFDLILTILGTFIFMMWMGIPLQRMSLGALIIALGMMVDNAIVVSDGIAVKIRQGVDRVEAAIDVAASNAYPLFAATLIAVMAFYPIYGSVEDTGEYCQTLFTVVAAALILSWAIAMFITPLQCIELLPDPDSKKSEKGEFDTGFYNSFRKVLKFLIRFRYGTLGVLIALLAVSIIGFGWVEQMFFPDSSRPQIMVDVWTPAGTRIGEVSDTVEKMEKGLEKDPDVVSVASFIGAGPPRFYLPVEPELPYSNYAQLIVTVDDHRKVNDFINKYERKTQEKYPEAMVRFRKFGVGPSNTWSFEGRISGPGKTKLSELRHLANEMIDITSVSPYGREWRTDMQNRELKLVSDFDQARARWSGVQRQNIAHAFKRGFDGLSIGQFREKDKLIPIVARSTEEERDSLANRLDLLQVQPSQSVQTLPLSQVIKGIAPEWEDPFIIRWNRRRAITVQGAPEKGDTFPTLFADVKPEVDQMKLPSGFEIYWDGEAESTRKSKASLIPGLIPAGISIVLLILTVFNAYRPLMIILCTIPFAIIGVTWGLLLLDTPFGFVALLGGMSLAGMMNKNIVVLLDACNDFLAQGKPPLEAITEAAVTRVRPVLLAAGTTVLGVIPLVADLFWTAMAVTIMGGLAFGSILTLVAVPVFYSIFYRIKGSAS